MRDDGSTGSRIPEPSGDDSGADAIVAAGGLHNYQLRCHIEYGRVVRLAPRETDMAVSLAAPVAAEATAASPSP